LIKTKSIYDKKEDSDGTRILITRYYPRGIEKEKFDRWYRELSPSKCLLKNFKDGMISQNVFFQFFCRDLRNDEKKLQLCKHLAIEVRTKLLLYYVTKKREFSVTDIMSKRFVSMNYLN
jgi:uncharacterized protein YeaO (DUF488 family)